MEKERQEIMNDKEHSIFDKSLDLNLKLVSKEMGRAVFWGGNDMDALNHLGTCNGKCFFSSYYDCRRYYFRSVFCDGAY